MRQIAAWGILIVVTIPGHAGDPWELVYPESRPTLQELDVRAHGSLPESRMHLAGSENGYAMAAVFGPEGPTVPWTVVKLPVEFDIFSVASSEERWIVAGTGGKLAVHDGLRPSAEAAESIASLQEDWSVHSIGTDAIITSIAALEETLIALADDQLFLSDDLGESWRPVDRPSPIKSLTTYQNNFFILESEVGPVPGDENLPGNFRKETVRLMVSADGMEWHEEWEIEGLPFMPPEGPTGKMGLHVVTPLEDWAGLPVNGTSRLIADINRWIYTEDPTAWIQATGQFSKFNDSDWVDHGAFTMSGGFETGRQGTSQWNPLDLPESRRNFPKFDLRTPHSLPAFSDKDPLSITRYTVSAWDNIAFRAETPDGMAMVSIDKDGDFQTYPIPDFISPFYYQGLYWKGDYYAKTGSGYVKTRDFVSYNSFSPPNGYWSRFYLVPGKTVLGLVTDGAIISDGNEIPLPFDVQGVVFHPSLNTWCLLRRDPQSGLVFESIDAQGNTSTIAEVFVEDYRQFRSLKIPDGETLVADSRDGDLIIVNPDGSTHRSNAWSSFPNAGSSISSIDFVNGWFYLSGRIMVRTRDFQVYEEVPLPTGESFFKVLGFDGWMYAFTARGVYRRPMERGFLNSIQMENNWYHSDWLGWFTIIDQDVGLIDHLRLGRATILDHNQDGYLIDTATLGIISTKPGWMPWFWRQQSGSWYYLDMTAWPPKAWDLNANQWIGLNP